MNNLLTVKATDTVGEVPEHEVVTDAYAWDDVNDKLLNPEMVTKARQEEMDYVKLKGVWEKVNIAEARAKGYKIVGTRWIDTDKGDENHPVYRSRLVGQEYNTGQEEGLFASTPPWRP